MSATAISSNVNAQGDDVIMQRLDDQIAWYSSKSSAAHRTFKRLKVAEIIAAAMIPFIAGLHFRYATEYSGLATGALGVLVTVIEGLIHLNQYQQNWTSYRATSEALKHEKFTYLAKAGPYAPAADPHALLAERVESLVSQEGARWMDSQQQEAVKK
jgi:Protein of unknown function (DUF4231)